MLSLVGCGAGGAAPGAQAPSAQAPSAQAPSAAAPTQSERRSARDPQRNDDSAASTTETFDELNLRYQEANVLERHLGTASYYADSLIGHRMANGQAYDPGRPTMAHRTLPFGTVVRVVRVSNGVAVTLCVADRGPFGNRRRVADLSREAARRLDMIRDGVVEVRLEVLGKDRTGQRMPSRRNRRKTGT
jgi:rare lipoprotein A